MNRGETLYLMLLEADCGTSAFAEAGGLVLNRLRCLGHLGIDQWHRKEDEIENNARLQRDASVLAGDGAAFLHKFRQSSGVSPLNQVIEVGLAIFGVGLHKGFVNAKRAFDARLVLGHPIVFLFRVLNHEGALRHKLAAKDGGAVFLVALEQLIEKDASVNRNVRHIDQPFQDPGELVLCIRAERIGLPRMDVFDRLLALFRGGWSAFSGKSCDRREQKRAAHDAGRQLANEHG